MHYGFVCELCNLVAVWSCFIAKNEIVAICVGWGGYERGNVRRCANVVTKFWGYFTTTAY